MFFVNCPISGRTFDQFQLRTGSWVQVLGDFIIKQLSCERKSPRKYKLSQKLKVEQRQLSSNRWMLQACRDVQQLRLTADFFKQFPFWIFRNSASFDAGLHNSDALNSISSISKSSISVLLKRSSSIWVVQMECRIKQVRLNGVWTYESMILKSFTLVSKLHFECFKA